MTSKSDRERQISYDIAYIWSLKKMVQMNLFTKQKESQKVKVKLLSCLQLFATPWTVAYQAPPSMGFSRQEYWSGLLLPPPGDLPDPGIEPRSPAFQADALKEIVNSPYHHPIYLSVQCCHSVVSNSLRPQGLQHCQPSLSITNT